MKSTSPWPSMFSVPPVLGVPEPGFTPCHPATVGPLGLPDDDVEPLLHAAARSARAARAAPAAKPREHFRIETLLLLMVVSEVRFAGAVAGGLSPHAKRLPTASTGSC